jgi:uncharacterized protein YuzE
MMRYEYDEASNALFIRFRDGDYDTSEEIYDGFVIDFDKSGRPLGIDIYSRASDFVDVAQLRRNLEPEAAPGIHAREPMYIRDAPPAPKKTRKKKS